jgi:hypothetical protein
MPPTYFPRKHGCRPMSQVINIIVAMVMQGQQMEGSRLELDGIVQSEIVQYTVNIGKAKELNG